MIGQPVRCSVGQAFQLGWETGWVGPTMEMQFASGALAHHCEPTTVTPFTSVSVSVSLMSKFLPALKPDGWIDP